jgi:hypothetical protein
MSPEATSNPIGPFRLRQVDKDSLRKPTSEVAEKQDANQTEADFMRDLDKATRRRAKA